MAANKKSPVPIVETGLFLYLNESDKTQDNIASNNPELAQRIEDFLSGL